MAKTLMFAFYRESVSSPTFLTEFIKNEQMVWNFLGRKTSSKSEEILLHWILL